MKILDKETERAGEVGAGWLNEDGSISIKLNMCVVLSEPDLVNRDLRLWPVQPKDDHRAKDSKGEAEDA